MKGKVPRLAGAPLRLLCLTLLIPIFVTASSWPMGGKETKQWTRSGGRAGKADHAPSNRKKLEMLRRAIAEYQAAHPARSGPLPASLRVLRDLARDHGTEFAARVARKLGMGVSGDSVLVTARTAEGKSQEAATILQSAGFTVLRAEPERQDLKLLVPFTELDRLMGSPEVAGVEIAPSFQLHAMSEGVAATQALPWEAYLGPSGLPLPRPVRVAIVDGGFGGYESLIGTDLPVDIDTAVFCAGYPGSTQGCDPFGPTAHGTAVAEIVHDMAPGARLLLATFNLYDEGSMQEALQYARDWKADIISESVGTIADNRDGKSPLCQTARDLRQDGILWVVSAGNDGSACNHEHYVFPPNLLTSGNPNGNLQPFPKKSEPYLNEFTLPANSVQIINLSWNAWQGAPSDDFDLYYLCDLGAGYQVIGSSTDVQCGMFGSVPVEGVAIQNGYDFPLACAYAVTDRSPQSCPHPASGVQFDAWSQTLTAGGGTCADLEEATSSFTISHPADCADTVATGAACVHDSQLEVYSSQGPNLDGLRKPEFCAPDAVTTATFGDSTACPTASGSQAWGFVGTSASAPHLAGALALLYERIGGSFSLEQCKQILERRASDITGDSAPDNVCGSGRLCMATQGCQ